MAHVAKFNAKQLAIFGKNETVANTAETLIDSNAIIMTGLTYDPNIASNSEQLAGDSLSRDTIFSITDSFAEFSGDTYLPVLGSLASNSVGASEVVQLTILAAASTNVFTLTDAVNTTTFTFSGNVIAPTLASIISDYFNSHTITGVANCTITEVGALYVQYSSVIDTANTSVVILTAETPFANLANLTVGGANSSLVTAVIKQGSSTITGSVPVTPFLSACNMHTIINTSLGLPTVVSDNFTTISSNLSTIKDNIAEARTNIAQIKSMVDASLQITESVAVTALQTDITTYPTKFDQLLTLVDDFANNIPTIRSTFASNIALNKITTALSALASDLASYNTEFTNATSAKITSFPSMYKKTSYTLNGRTIENTSATGYASNTNESKALIYFALKTGLTADTPVTINGQVFTYHTASNLVTKGVTEVGSIFGAASVTLTLAFTTSSILTITKSSALTSANITALTFKDANNVSLESYTLVPPASLTATAFLTTDTDATKGLVDAITTTDSIYATRIINTFNSAKLLLATILPKLTSTGITTSCAYLANAMDTATYTITNLSTVFKSIDFTNSLSSNSTLTCNIRKNSYDITEQKNIVITGAKGTVDLNIKIGERPKLKLNLHGNFRASGVASNDDPLSNNLTVQKANIAPVTQYSNIVLASIYPTGTGIGKNNIAFQSLSATNVDGFSLERTLTGDGNFWYPNPIAHDVTISILEEQASTTDFPDSYSFHPEDNIGKEFDFIFTQGEADGTTYSVKFTKMTLKSYKHSTQGNVSTQDLTFECAGTSTITLR